MKRVDLADRGDVDLAGEVRARVTMTDVVTRYTGQPIQNRIPCPFHHGRDRNMAIYRDGYKCYVCGESGDQIGYVRKLFGLDFMGAVERIDRDFGLGLPLRGTGAADPALLREAALRAERRRREALEEEERREDREALWDLWCLCDRILREEDPDGDPYALAAKTIDWVGYLINLSEDEEWRIKTTSQKATP